ncbi:MAG: HlyD family efflux transporter periplasmic adaptor subunit [Planctomycetota bacterium]
MVDLQVMIYSQEFRPMRFPCQQSSFCIVFLLLGLTTAFAQDSPKSDDAESEPKVVKIPGVFEAVATYEVTADNEHLTDLVIERIVPHGTMVKKGQSLVWFETEAMSDKLKAAEIELELAKLAHEADTFAFEQAAKERELDKAAAKRARDAAQQEFDNYQKVDRERQIKQANFSLESSKYSLENAKEEYGQLEKMYKEDDLTEESEMIVLRRAKRSVDSAKFSLEGREISTERTIKQAIPLADKDQEDKLARALMTFEKSNLDLTIGEKKAELEMQQKQTKFDKQLKDIEEMREERKRVVLKAENDGIFIHGPLNRGKLGPKPSELEEGDKASGKQVLGVVADPSTLQIRVDLAEDKLALVREGTSCMIVPKSMPERTIEGAVKSVSSIPFASGKFDCVVTISGTVPPELVPTMSCELVFENDEPEDD